MCKISSESVPSNFAQNGCAQKYLPYDTFIDDIFVFYKHNGIFLRYPSYVTIISYSYVQFFDFQITCYF